MLLRTSILALALAVGAPMAAQAQTVDFGAGGPSLDLRSKKQRAKDDVREDMARQKYRRDAQRDRYRDRDRDMSTGSVRRYDDRYDRSDRYDSGRGRY